MKNMTLENIAKACNGKYVGALEDKTKIITGAQLDSRKIEAGNLFIATRGEKVDGHSFIAQVFEKGAYCVICEKEPENKPYILVEDSFVALKQIAKYYRQQLTIPIIGITGSVGKTSTKEAIASVLSTRYNTLRTEGNFNNEIGLPLTILSIKPEHEIAVCEMGISDFGEMDRLSDIATPDICVITNIGQCHLENLGTQQGILKAKTEMFNHRNKSGAVILNGDDPLLNTVEQVDGTIPLRFGHSDACKVKITQTNLFGFRGSEFSLELDGEVIKCETILPGGHVIVNAACAAAVGKVVGLSNEEIVRGIENQQAIKGRSNVIDKNGCMIIDDCYNANPVSMKEAIDLLVMSESRKVAVLGDMFELGENAKKLHYEIGAYAARKNIDLLLCAGELSENIFKGAVDNGLSDRVKYYKTRDELMAELPENIKKGDSVLIKASHGMHYEEIVKVLTC